MTDELAAIDAVFRGDRELLLRHELRHCDRSQLEALIIALCMQHDLCEELTARLAALPRTVTSDKADDSLPDADDLVAREERRLGNPRP